MSGPLEDAAPPADLLPEDRPQTYSLMAPAGSTRRALGVSVADAFVELLSALGVRHAFGIIGGAIAPFAEALSASSIQLLHFRHEAGAAFAAIEASLATGEPVVVFATTGPGLTNLLTGMIAARSEGARVVFVSGATNAAQRGRAPFQETSAGTGGCGFLYESGGVFHHAQLLEDAAELEALAARLQMGLLRSGGFVAHVGLPLSVQTARFPQPVGPRLSALPPSGFDPESAEHCARLLSREPFVLWVGFGARGAALQVRELAERSGAAVMCSPRAKGIMPEDHPLFLGVTGLGGHEAVRQFLSTRRPSRVLVLGSRLGELTSFWSQEYLPRDGLIHVDVDAAAFGVGFPGAPTLCVQADIGAFLSALLSKWPAPSANDGSRLPPAVHRRDTDAPGAEEPGEDATHDVLVRPSYLFSRIQRRIVERSSAILLTEAGNSFLLGSRHLAFREPGRYRVSTSFGSMGQAVAGVIGAALAHGKAIGIVGDGAMLMHNELTTARQYGIAAVWIVLNDARYGMIAQGMQSVGWVPFETDFPRVDFVTVARGMGVPGLRVTRESALDEGLDEALEASEPFVLDVWIDRDEPPVQNPRNQSLIDQGLNGTGAA